MENQQGLQTVVYLFDLLETEKILLKIVGDLIGWIQEMSLFPPQFAYEVVVESCIHSVIKKGSVRRFGVNTYKITDGS
ncbi:hypothetical protein [Paenibacillus sp. Soil787]|uniref:hypothetical protein n=1 Tax=Paenibacillus sp. Soil787 TaxID=1736411 RepID=UPI000702CD5B|nr:hypothetical protein [Paenibacillus sp. Soil787]KRF21466.1 hypothetical protein ASG93_08820 [Paenibacillus sp. Soil787]